MIADSVSETPAKAAQSRHQLNVDVLQRSSAKLPFDDRVWIDIGYERRIVIRASTQNSTWQFENLFRSCPES
jgi:hypothetical protein